MEPRTEEEEAKETTARANEVVMAEVAEQSRSRVDEKTAERFYDRVRENIRAYMTRKGDRLGRAKEFLFLVPDVFILLWRLANDKRVGGKNKVLLGTGIAYYILPLDIMPEALLGPIGFLDDLVFSVYILNKIMLDTDEEIVREHWSGSEDVLAMIRRVLESADGLVTSGFLKTIKKWLS
jgi:uncharacterized membrane protein YkvA (DUF1232 family)